LKCQFEILDVNDLSFAYKFLQTRDTNKLYTINYSNGEVCGVIRCVRIASHGMPTAEQVDLAMRDEITL